MVHGTIKNRFKPVAIIPLPITLQRLEPSPYTSIASIKKVAPNKNVSGTIVQLKVEKFTNKKVIHKYCVNEFAIVLLVSQMITIKQIELSMTQATNGDTSLDMRCGNHEIPYNNGRIEDIAFFGSLA
jgi:hypothetical protein